MVPILMRLRFQSKAGLFQDGCREPTGRSDSNNSISGEGTLSHSIFVVHFLIIKTNHHASQLCSRKRPGSLCAPPCCAFRESPMRASPALTY